MLALHTNSVSRSSGPRSSVVIGGGLAPAAARAPAPRGWPGSGRRAPRPSRGASAPAASAASHPARRAHVVVHERDQRPDAAAAMPVLRAALGPRDRACLARRGAGALATARVASVEPSSTTITSYGTSPLLLASEAASPRGSPARLRVGTTTETAGAAWRGRLATPLVTEAAPPRVLVVHNRYRAVGGEERSVELHCAALERAGIAARAARAPVGRRGPRRAAAAMLRGGSGEAEVAARGAGARRRRGARPQHAAADRARAALEAARDAGAKVVLHLHNVRLFCATGFGERDGGPCARCRGRNTLPGLRLNCRGSLPEAAVYAAALSAHQPRGARRRGPVRGPQRGRGRRGWPGAACPRERVERCAHYLPAEAFAARSRAPARAATRWWRPAVAGEGHRRRPSRAAAAAGVPLRVAGDGPGGHASCEALAARSGADVTLPGPGRPRATAALLAGAAAVLMPSRYHEFSPYSALEAMAQGVPVVATAMGGLPELLGAGALCPGAGRRTPSPPAWPRSGPTRACARRRARHCTGARGNATPRSVTWGTSGRSTQASERERSRETA